jgi:hypothetical protein
MCTQVLRRSMLLTVLITALCGGVAQADFSGAALTGSQFFSGVASDGRALDVRVDYGVYDPGDFAGTFARWYSPDYVVPSTDYIYAYQIFNIGQSNNSTVLSQLSINATGTVSAIGYLSGSAGLGATIGAIGTGGSSMQYYFLGAGLLPGAHSNVLLAASPEPPAFLSASIYDHGASDAKTLPSPAPVPAPGAAGLVLVGLGLLTKRRWIGA